MKLVTLDLLTLKILKMKNNDITVLTSEAGIAAINAAVTAEANKLLDDIPSEVTAVSIQDTANSVFVNEDGTQKDFNLTEVFTIYDKTPEALIIEDRYALVNFKIQSGITLTQIDEETLTQYYIKYIDRVRISWKGKPAQCRIATGYRESLVPVVEMPLLKIYVPHTAKMFYVDNANNDAFATLTWAKNSSFKPRYESGAVYDRIETTGTWSQFWKEEPKKNINNAVRRIIGGTKTGKHVEFRSKK